MRRGFLLTNSIIMITLTLGCQLSRGNYNYRPPTGEGEALVNYDRVSRKVLDNGLTVITKEIPNSPLAAIQVWVNAGSITEGKFTGSGISHYVEHMLFKGTKNRAVGEMSREIRRLGGQLNAFTSYEHTMYHIVLPKEHMEKGLEIQADAIRYSSFDPQECEREKQVILKEINMGDDDPQRYLFRTFAANLYQVHPYRHPVIGYREVFSKLTRDDLLDYYQGMYLPSNMVLVVVGGVKKESVWDKVDEVFGDFSRQPSPPMVLPKEQPVMAPRAVEREFPIQIARLSLGFPTVDLRDPDLYPLDVLATIMGSGRASRLYRKLKEERGLVYEINCESYTPSYQGFLLITASLDYQKTDQVKEALWEELQAVAEGGVSDEELDRAKAWIVSEFLVGQERVESQARDLGNNEATLGDFAFSGRYLEGIQQVTPEDISRIAGKYLVSGRETMVALKPKAEAGHPKPQEPPPTEKAKISKTVLGNGLRALIQAEPKLPLVGVKLLVGGGVRAEEAADNGVFNFIQQMLLKGTKRHSASELSQELEMRGIRLDTDAGSSSVGCNMVLQSQHLKFGLKMLSEILFEPAFPTNELELTRRKILADIKDDEDELFPVARKLLMKALYLQHPYRQPITGDKETVAALGRDTLLEVHRRLYVPGNMVLAIFGQVNPEETKRLLEETFGTYPGVSYPRLSVPQEEPISSVRERQAALEKKQTLLLLGYRGTSIDSPDRYPLQALTYILSGMGSRIFDNLREQKGLAYYAGAFMFIGLEPGAYVFYAGTTADKAELAKQELLLEVERLRKEMVTSEELDMAKENIIGSRRIERQQNLRFADEAAQAELFGLGYEEIYQFEDKVRQITRKDILSIAQKYFAPGGYAAVTVGDLP